MPVTIVHMRKDLHMSRDIKFILDMRNVSSRQYMYYLFQSVICKNITRDCFFSDCHKSRIAWWWKNWLQGSRQGSDQLSKDEFISLIHSVSGK